MSVVLVSMTLPRLQEPVVHPQVYINNGHIGHRGDPAAFLHESGHRLAIDRPVPVEQRPQRLVDDPLPLARRQQEDRQVLLDRGAVGPPALQRVVGHPESARGEHRIAVAVLLERPRLAYQPVDDVAILDAMLAAPAESGQAAHHMGPVPDFQGLQADVDIDLLADQAARHRVGVAADMDRAPGIDPRLDPARHLQPPRGERLQRGLVLGESSLAIDIAPGHELAQERPVIAAAGEIAAPSQHQRLVDGLLEPVMALLDVAVLVGLPRLDRLRLEAIVLHQGLVFPSEHLGLRIVVDRRGQAIGAMPPGDPSQFPQGVLQPFVEALEALGEADRAGLPVGVGEHEVIDQVIEGFAGDGDAEVAHMGEVALGEPSRFVSLSEEHLLGRAFERPPSFDPPLQGAKLHVGEPPRMAALQVEEEGIGLEPGIEAELGLELGPDVLERVLPCPPGVWGASLAGKQVRVTVLASGLLVDVRPVRGVGQSIFDLDQLPQPPELSVGDHPGVPAR